MSDSSVARCGASSIMASSPSFSTGSKTICRASNSVLTTGVQVGDMPLLPPLVRATAVRLRKGGGMKLGMTTSHKVGSELDASDAGNKVPGNLSVTALDMLVSRAKLSSGGVCLA